MAIDLTDPRQTLELLNALLSTSTDALTHPGEIPSQTAQTDVSTPTDALLTPLTPPSSPGGVRGVSGASVRPLTRENRLQDGKIPASVSASVPPRSGDLLRGGAPPGAGGGDLEAAHREAWGLVEELRRLNREMAEAWARRLNRTPLEDRPRQVQELRTSLAQLLAEKEAQPWPS